MDPLEPQLRENRDRWGDRESVAYPDTEKTELAENRECPDHAVRTGRPDHRDPSERRASVTQVTVCRISQLM